MTKKEVDDYLKKERDFFNYVKEQLKQGVRISKIRNILIENGWPEYKIEEAFEKYKNIKPEIKQLKLRLLDDKEEADDWPEPEDLPEETFKDNIVSLEKPQKSNKRSNLNLSTSKFNIKNWVLANTIIILAILFLIVIFFIFFFFPSSNKGSEPDNSVSKDVSFDVYNSARQLCHRYCENNLCGFFTNPGFTSLELKGKNCKDLGFSCLQKNGLPKCETEY